MLLRREYFPVERPDRKYPPEMILRDLFSVRSRSPLRFYRATHLF